MITNSKPITEPFDQDEKFKIIVIDFGLTRWFNSDYSYAGGNKAYKSPEAIELRDSKEHPLTKMDIYSVGAIIIDLILFKGSGYMPNFHSLYDENVDSIRKKFD